VKPRDIEHDPQPFSSFANCVCITRSIFSANYEAPITYEEKIIILNSPGNGNSDIYWVDAQIIEDFQKEIFSRKSMNTE
jgi:hypothetical protein